MRGLPQIKSEGEIDGRFFTLNRSKTGLCRGGTNGNDRSGSIKKKIEKRTRKKKKKQSQGLTTLAKGELN